MRFTELSNRKLEVGQYLITAIFDGNSSYLPRETHHTLTINAKPVPARAAARSVTDPDEPTITKTSPPIYFTANSTQFTNYKGRELLFRWLNIETELPLEYTIDGSAGESSLDVVEEDGIIYFSWSDNGNYTLTLTTVENKYFYQKTITMDIIVSDSRQSPMIEYSTTNNPNLRQVGDRLYRYLEGNDGERLHALYHFDYERPTNPYNLDIEYGMYDTNTDPYVIDKFAGMSNDGSKIRTSKTTGTYVLVARFNGNDSYYPTESRYYISFSSESEEKITPNLSWSSQTGSYDIYTFIGNTPILINPYNVSPIVYSSSNTTVATIDQTGNITYHSEGTCTITATFAGDVSYYGATATYVLIVSDSTPSQEKVSPNMYFINDTVSFEQNASDWYDLQVPVKPNSVEGYYEVLYNGVSMTVLSGKVNVQNLGNYVVRYIFNGNDTYLSQTITYTLVIAEEVSGLLPAELSWSSSTSTADINSQQNTYPTLTNPHSLPITYSTSDSTIANIGSDGSVFLYSTGEVTISAIFSGDQTYEQQTVTYTLTVTDSSSQRPSPNLSWSAQTGNYDLYTSSGDTITLSNPYGVVVSYDSSNPSVATITTQGVITYHSVGTTIISARYTGSRYLDQTVTYTLTVLDSTPIQLISPNLSFSSDSGSYDIYTSLGTLPTFSNPYGVNISWSCDNMSVAMVSGDNSSYTINYYGTGSCHIIASFDGDSTYEAQTVTFTLTVADSTPVQQLINPDISWSSNGGVYNMYNQTRVIPTFNNPNSVSPIVYSSSNTNVAMIDSNGNITYAGVGTCSITASFSGDSTYYQSSVDFTLKVVNTSGKISPNLSFSSNYGRHVNDHNEYDSLPTFNNPYGVTGITWSEQRTSSGSFGTLTGDDSGYSIGWYNYKVGADTITATFSGDSIYEAQTVTFTLHAYRLPNSVFKLSNNYIDYTSSGYTHNNIKAIYNITTHAGVIPTLQHDDKNEGNDTNHWTLASTTYSSSDPTVATINSNGNLTYIYVGTTTISATSVWRLDEIEYTIEDTYELTVTDTKINLNTGQIHTGIQGNTQTRVTSLVAGLGDNTRYLSFVRGTDTPTLYFNPNEWTITCNVSGVVQPFSDGYYLREGFMIGRGGSIEGFLDRAVTSSCTITISFRGNDIFNPISWTIPCRIYAGGVADVWTTP